MVILLGFITVAFIEDAKEQILYDAQFQSNEDLRAEAYSALEVTLAVLNVFHEIDEQLWGPAQGWGDPLEFADYTPPPNTTIEVAFREESGRFPLSTLSAEDYDRMRKVFDVLGFDQRDAEELTDSLLDWIDDDDLPRLNGFDAEDYRKLNPPYLPANAPLRSWDELALIPAFKERFWDEDGRPLPELRTFTEAFSLHHTGPVNLNAASDFVISVLEEMGIVNADYLHDYLNGPDRKPDTGDERVIRSLEEAGVLLNPDLATSVAGNEASLLEVTVEVARGESRFLLRTLVSWRGAQTQVDERDDNTEPATETTEGARTDGETDPDRKARGNVATATGEAADLGYPFQIHWVVENRKI